MARWFRMRLAVSIAIGAVLLLACSSCDWLQLGFSGGNDFANPSEPALMASTVGSLTQRYTLGSSGVTYGSPVIANGTLYAATSQPSGVGVSAIRVSDGSPLWTTLLWTKVVGRVAYDSGTVFLGAGGTIFALDASSGAIRWTQTIANLDGGPVIDGGRLFFMTSYAVDMSGISVPFEGIVAVDEAPGATLWTTSFQNYPGTYSGGLVASNGLVSIIGTTQKTPPQPPFFPVTSVFHEADGSGAGGYNFIAVSVAANGLLYGQYDFNPPALWEAIDPTSGSGVWSVSPPTVTVGPYLPPTAVSSNSLVSGNSNGGLTALDAKTGATQWTTQAPSGVTLSGQPVSAGSLVYVLGTNSTGSVLVSYDASTGALTSTVPVVNQATSVIVSEGRVFVEASNGTITAYVPSG